MSHLLPFETDEQADYTVRYEPHDPEISVAFAELRHLIQTAAGPVRIEHVGSTSIPGVGGRNAIDIALPITPEEQPKVKAALLGIGFQDSPFPHYLPLLVARYHSRGKEYPVLLYLVAPESQVYADWLAFRTHMRSNPTDAAAYDALKRTIASGGSVKGDRYQELKSPFLASFTAKLRSERTRGGA